MFTITTTQHGGRNHGQEITIAQTPDYQTARGIAEAESARTSGRYVVTPPEGSLVRPESFANGMSEG